MIEPARVIGRSVHEAHKQGIDRPSIPFLHILRAVLEEELKVDSHNHIWEKPMVVDPEKCDKWASCDGPSHWIPCPEC